ncbi:MAG: hypothetical protein FD544_000015 [Pelagibacterales bacterium]|jgi:acyl carrier protein|nr:hypothetical protein [Pelagibacterales bacterium]
MKKKPSKIEIIKIISKILKMTPAKLEKIDNYTKMKSWDSLAHLDILSALDTRLNNKISKIKNISEVMSIKKIILILKKKSLIVL